MNILTSLTRFFKEKILGLESKEGNSKKIFYPFYVDLLKFTQQINVNSVRPLSKDELHEMEGGGFEICDGKLGFRITRRYEPGFMGEISRKWHPAKYHFLIPVIIKIGEDGYRREMSSWDYIINSFTDEYDNDTILNEIWKVAKEKYFSSDDYQSVVIAEKMCEEEANIVMDEFKSAVKK